MCIQLSAFSWFVLSTATIFWCCFALNWGLFDGGWGSVTLKATVISKKKKMKAWAVVEAETQIVMEFGEAMKED